MKEMDFLTFYYVFVEMLGVLLWPLVFVAIFLVLAFVLLLVYDKGVKRSRCKASFIAGILGGFLGVVFLFKISSSTGLSNIGGPLDWIMLTGTFAGGFVAGAVLFYTILGWLAAIRSSECKLSSCGG